MDVDYGGDTLTYMVSLTNASANAKYYVVVYEGQNIVYEKEIIDGYQTGIVQGLDGTKDHRVEIRTGLVPLYVVDSATIQGQNTPFDPVEVNSLTASLNTITYDVTLKAGATATMGIYPAEGEAAVFTKPLVEGPNTGTVTELLYNHEYVVKFFDEKQTYIIKAVTTERMDSDIVITGIEGLTYLSAEKALVTRTGNDEQIVQYSVNGGAWITTIPEFTDAGEYTVRYKADESNSYRALPEGSVTVTVAKVDGAMTAPTGITGLVYDGTDQALVNAGSSSDGTVKYSLTFDGDYQSEVPAMVNAGGYTVYYMLAGDVNHNDIAPSAENYVAVSVSKATYDMSGASWDYVSAFTYDASQKRVRVTGLPEGVTVTEYANHAKTNAGNYTASVVSFDYDEFNYNEPTIDDCNWSINPATASASISRTYGSIYNTGGNQNIPITVNNLTGGSVKYYTSFGSEASYEVLTDPLTTWDDNPTGNSNGTYYVYYKIVADGSGNYSDLAPSTSNKVNVTIVTPEATVDSGTESGNQWITDVTFNFDNYSDVTYEAEGTGHETVNINNTQDIANGKRIYASTIYLSSSYYFYVYVYLNGDQIGGNMLGPVS